MTAISRNSSLPANFLKLSAWHSRDPVSASSVCATGMPKHSQTSDLRRNMGIVVYFDF
jgi:hypothetical protein